MTGEEMYNIWRARMNATRRGNNPEPSWKRLKPWLKRVWDKAAQDLSREAGLPSDTKFQPVSKRWSA